MITEMMLTFPNSCSAILKGSFGCGREFVKMSRVIRAGAELATGSQKEDASWVPSVVVTVSSNPKSLVVGMLTIFSSPPLPSTISTSQLWLGVSE